MNRRGLVLVCAALLPYIPGGDAFAPQSYAYFLRKASTIRWTIDDLKALLAAVE